MPSHHTHPSPVLDMLTQYGAIAFLLATMLILISQVVLAFSGAPAFLLVLTSVTLILLVAPALMLTTATPAVSVDEADFTLHPRVWPRRAVLWSDVLAVKPYPLLPPADTERARKALVGRRKYRAAQGIMLIVPSLPWMYRLTGFFAGEGFRPVIAFTNRTHEDYSTLVERVRAHTPGVWE